VTLTDAGEALADASSFVDAVAQYLVSAGYQL
jgi:hypothetical protein